MELSPILDGLPADVEELVKAANELETQCASATAASREIASDLALLLKDVPNTEGLQELLRPHFAMAPEGQPAEFEISNLEDELGNLDAIEDRVKVLRKAIDLVPRGRPRERSPRKPKEADERIRSSSGADSPRSTHMLTVVDPPAASAEEKPRLTTPTRAIIQHQIDRLDITAKTLRTDRDKLTEALNSLKGRIESVQIAAFDVFSVTTSPTGRSRAAVNSVPPTQVDDVFGQAALAKVAKTFFARYAGPNVRWQGRQVDSVHPLDTQRFLQDEIIAAYEFLRAHDLWSHAEGLADLVRGESYTGRGGLWERRNDFYRAVRAYKNTPSSAPPESVPSNPTEEMSAQHNHNDSCFAVVAQARKVAAETRSLLGREDPSAETAVEALAWAVIVESALLNAQLLDDMQRISVAKGCPGCVCPSGMMYLPDPTEEDRLAFMEYVRCRWPIHVFALDPVTQDQNIAEEYSRTRELQLAASLAFVTGEMNTAAFMRFSRTLQYDLATITLNRTVAGFSHGDDTFGWRFYPRLQPPRPKGTIRVMGETLFGGPGPDADLLDRGIEPGMRECVAIVIMPSFVPYVTFDVHSNWFRLNQKHGLAPWKDATEISMVDTVKLSRSVRSMREQAQMICDAGMYRDGEVDRLLRRVHQLDRELPLQTMQGLVPIENTLGGFELFNAGVTDLAPELSGWYGAPGILIGEMPTPAPHCSNEAAPMGSEAMTQYLKPVTDSNLVAPLPPPKDCTCSGTTLFLVGKHFSVHDTKVIAGGKCIPYFTLLSREVMRVTIPPDINIDEVEQVLGPTKDDIRMRKFVDVHVATPYGVTGHLHIPVYEPSKKEAPKPAPEGSGVKWKPGEIQVAVTFDKNGNLANAAVDGSSAPAFALINENTGKLGYPLTDALARLRFVAARIKDKTLPLSKPYEPKCIEPTKFFANKTEYDLKLSDDLTTVLKALFEGAGINATNLPDAVIADAAIVFGQGFRVEPFDNTLTLRLVKATSSGGGAAGPTASNADLSPRRLAGPPPSTAARH